MKQKGFTLIELLVVIAIIGLLSALAVVSLSSARNKAYDAQIKNDVGQIRKAAEVYASDTGSYAGFAVPTILSGKVPTCAGMTGNNYQLIPAAAGFSVASKLCAGASANTDVFCADSTGYAGLIPNLPASGDITCL